ncbi:MAG: YkvA family protein [Gammaproteobacteria bacterium]|nr:YkvA family protein [Gammaproteobacteria bacterium]
MASRKSKRLLEKLTGQASEADIQKIDARLDAKNRGKVREVWDQVQLLWRMVKDPKAAWPAKAQAIGALVYLISPIDAVPDPLPIVGLVDDVAIILLVVKALADALEEYVAEVARRHAEIQVRKHYKMVLASVLGAVAIAAIAFAFQLL